jgi:hypothetical protein
MEQLISSNQYIEGKLITLEDIGSPVTYVPKRALGNANHSSCERGTIKRVTEYGVFVNYVYNVCLTPPELLVWG